MAEAISKEEFIKALKANTTIPEATKLVLLEALENAPAKQKFDSRVNTYLQTITDKLLTVDDFMDFLSEEYGYDASTGTFADPEAAKEVAKEGKKATSKEAQAKADIVSETPDIAKPLALEDFDGPAYDAQTMDADRPIIDDGMSFEVSSKGDELGKQFSALNATFKEGPYAGKTIEDVWQNEIKKSGKGKAPSKESELFGKSLDDSRLAYQELWEMWAAENPELISQLADKVNEGFQLTDSFAKEGTVNQAEALTNIIYNLNNEIKQIKIAEKAMDKIPFNIVDGNQPGAGASKSTSNNWAARTAENYMAAAKSGGFTVDFSVSSGGSGSTKKSGTYEPNLKQLRGFENLKGLSDKEILDETYKQVRLTNAGKFVDEDAVKEIAALVAKALNEGKTINIAGNQVWKFKGATQTTIDKIFANFMDMVQDNPVNDWSRATIRSGGQNGFDLSALRWASFFKVPFRLHTGKDKLYRKIGGTSSADDVFGELHEYFPLLQYDENNVYNNELLHMDKTKEKPTQNKSVVQPNAKAAKLSPDNSKTLKRLIQEYEGVKDAGKSVKDQWWKSLTVEEKNYIKTIIDKKNTPVQGTETTKAPAGDIPSRKVGKMELGHFWLNNAYNEMLPVSSVDGSSAWKRYIPMGVQVYDNEINPNKLINNMPATTAFEPVQILRGFQTGLVLPETMADITKNPEAYIQEGEATYQRTKPGEIDPRTTPGAKGVGKNVEPLVLEGGSAEVKGLIKEGDIITAGFASNAERTIVDYVSQQGDVGARPAAGLGVNYGVPVKVLKAWQLPEKIDDTFFETPLAKKMAESLNLTQEALREKLLTGKKNKKGEYTMNPFNTGRWNNGWFYEIEPIELNDENYKWEKVQQIHMQADIESDVAIKNWMGHKFGMLNLGAVGGLLMKVAPIVDYGEYVFGFGAKGVNALIKQAETGFIKAQSTKYLPGNNIYSKLAREVGDVRKGLLPKTRGFLGEMGTRGTITAFGEGVESKVGKRVAASPAKGLVKGVGAYEKYNFLYGLASGLLLSAIETMGIIGRDTIGDNNIRTQLGGDYEAWAESNGIIDKVGPWPLISSLEKAESLGYLDEGFTQDYINETNNKWMGVVHEFLGTEHYDQMDKVNVIWEQGRRPKGWFTSWNDIFGLNSEGALRNAGLFPRTGLAPAIKRSPIVSGIEIPFENWFLPKVGLESWVVEDTPLTEQDEEDFANQIGQIPATVDNNAWLMNVADMGDY